MIVVGIDPGQRGGLAALDKGHVVEAIAMPVIGKNIDFVAVADWIRSFTDPFVCIEQVGARPGQGVVSMFNFGFGAGGLYGITSALKIPTKSVLPSLWQTILKGTKKDKAATIMYVRKMHPEVSLLATDRSRVPHDGIAAAICIAEFAYRYMRKKA